MRSEIVTDVTGAIMGFVPATVTFIKHTEHDYRSGEPKVRVVDLR